MGMTADFFMLIILLMMIIMTVFRNGSKSSLFLQDEGLGPMTCFLVRPSTGQKSATHLGDTL